MRVYSDDRFDSHFRNVKQVFLYLTDHCNLSCTQCYYRPWLRSSGTEELGIEVIRALLTKCRTLGAEKLSLLGGEPLLYGLSGVNPRIGAVIRLAHDLGFQYIRLVTNGLLLGGALAAPDMRLLDEISLSIDGDCAEIHDSLRGQGSFAKAISAMQLAIASGFTVHVTTCVHTGNCGADAAGRVLLDRHIQWAERIGVRVVNFHPLFKLGIPRDSWSGRSHISAESWIALYSNIRSNIEAGCYQVAVRIPQRFVSREELERDPERYSYCPLRLGERLEVHANGQMHICALHNGTPVCLARFSVVDGGLQIKWNEHGNELGACSLTNPEDKPCCVIERTFGSFVPLCISFKPRQTEFVWRELGLP
jgi:MoaA/NifB/PqqE/SkfB family radical SAM enzyme